MGLLLGGESMPGGQARADVIGVDTPVFDGVEPHTPPITFTFGDPGHQVVIAGVAGGGASDLTRLACQTRSIASPTDTIFELAELHYHNGVTVLGTSPTDYHLTFDVALTSPTVQEITFGINLHLDITPNGQIASADTLTLPTSISSGSPQLHVLGFGLDAQHILPSVTVAEQGSASLPLWAVYDSTVATSTPLPAAFTGALVLLALVGIGRLVRPLFVISRA